MSTVSQQMNPKLVTIKDIVTFSGTLSLKWEATKNQLKILEEANALHRLSFDNYIASNGLMLKKALKDLTMGLFRTMEEVSDVVSGFRVLAFDDKLDYQAWTDLLIASIRRFAINTAEAAKYLTYRLHRPRILSKASKVEVFPVGQYLALFQAITLNRVEDNKRAQSGFIPKDQEGTDLTSEDIYLVEMFKALADLKDVILTISTMLITVFELTWPGIKQATTPQGQAF